MAKVRRLSLACELGRLHLLGGDLALADAVDSAHLLHGGEVFGLEVDEALVEAVDLRVDHEGGERVLEVSRLAVHVRVHVD